MVTLPSFRRLVAGLFVAAALPAGAATLEPGSPDFKAKAEALARAHSAVVAVRSTAVDEAGSIDTLGRERRGSGVVIDADGLILTIGYLILEADHVDVVVEGERTVPARVVAYDLASGFGLLQALTPVRVAPVALGRSEGLSGDEPLMIASGGAEGGLSLARMVSQRAFSGYWEYHIEQALFTRPARTDHGGAGLFNRRGELLGIGSLLALETPDEYERGPGSLFVPVDLLSPIYAELRSRGTTSASRRAWLGVDCVQRAEGVRVQRVVPDSPAADAGAEPGDLIRRIDGVPVGDRAAFYRRLWSGAVERQITLEVLRDGEAVDLTMHSIDRAQALRRAGGI
jgi:serine protease Do